jgi:hypothetical protein
VRRPALVVLVLLLAGCSVGGGDGATVELAQLPRLVLQPEDLPPVFRRFDEGRQVIADNPGGSRADPDRFGRRDGWKARYHRSGTQQTTGPIVVESRVDLFDSSGGAEDDLQAARSDLTEGELEWQPIDEPGLGDESFAATLVQEGAGSGVRHYHVYWRDDNVTAFLNVNGFEERLALEEVLELARRQEGRISSASGA